MNLKKLRKDESGATAVIVAILMVVLVGMIALVIDFGRGYTTKVNMQSACDLAAMAGANELAKNLSNTSGASSAAYNFASKNGFKKNDVQVTIIDGVKVRVDINNTQHNLAAGIVGVNEMNIKCTATASVVGVDAVHDFPYSIFSGSETDELKMNSGSYTVYGSIHSNAKLSFGAGYTKAQGFSAVKGGKFDYNSYMIKIYIHKLIYGEIII